MRIRKNKIKDTLLIGIATLIMTYFTIIGGSVTYMVITSFIWIFLIISIGNLFYIINFQDDQEHPDYKLDNINMQIKSYIYCTIYFTVS